MKGEQIRSEFSSRSPQQKVSHFSSNNTRKEIFCQGSRTKVPNGKYEFCERKILLVGLFVVHFLELPNMEFDKLSTSQIREASRDIEEIYQVAKKSSSAVIQSHIVSYIDDFRSKLLAASKENAETLRIKVRFSDGLVAILANLSSTMSLSDLKTQIEDSKDGPFQLLKLLLVRTNTDITGFDDTSLVDAGVCNNDVFIAEGNCSALASMSVQQSSSPPAFEILASSNLQYSCAEEVFFVGLHCCLLEEGMICMVEMPNSVPGFAPSLKGDRKTKKLRPPTLPFNAHFDDFCTRLDCWFNRIAEDKVAS